MLMNFYGFRYLVSIETWRGQTFSFSKQFVISPAHWSVSIEILGFFKNHSFCLYYGRESSLYTRVS